MRFPGFDLDRQRFGLLPYASVKSLRWPHGYEHARPMHEMRTSTRRAPQAFRREYRYD